MTPHVPRPALRWTSRPRSPQAVVVVLHGGAETSTHEVRWLDPAVLRLLPFARRVARVGGSDLAVVRVRFAVRGWNGAAASPVADARWALGQVRAAYPGLPIGVVGHSLGGRVALHIAADADVTAVVALAPWVAASDVPHGGPGLRLLVIHGTDDHVTSPVASEAMVGRLSALGARAAYEAVEGENHAFLRHPHRAHQRVAGWLVSALTTGAPTP